MPPRPLLLGQRIERLQRAVGYHHLIGVRLDIGKSTVEVKEKKRSFRLAQAVQISGYPPCFLPYRGQPKLVVNYM